ncbi:hypothetical protein [uncultured Fibrella sp.]|uniref:hypothetical protein n=1 Tax=uncultured Fibrella sp. TaxID=1284596 RepID=UPI0035CA074C
MIYAASRYSSYFSSLDRPTLNRARSESQLNQAPPKKPDWLLILVSILFLITLLIAWAVDLPAFNW